MRPAFPAFLIASLSLTTGSAAFAQGSARAESPSFSPGERAPRAGEPTGRYVVDLVDSANPDELGALWARIGATLVDNSPAFTDDDLLFVGALNERSLAALQGDALVEGVEPEVWMGALHVPNDPEFARQWHLSRVGAERAWDYGCGRGVTVAVIDTGVACYDAPPFSHGTDLHVGSCQNGYNFVAGTPQAADDHGHGTHVAGTIAQATGNALGGAGLAHCAKVMPIKVLSGSGYGTNADVAEGIRFAADHGAQVLNLSLGSPFPSRIVAKAVAYAQARGALVVAAAGNNGGAVGYPAAYEGVLAVSATDRNDRLAWFSSRGRSVGLAAPGVAVLQQTVCDAGRAGCEQWAAWNGTSMAAPHVAAAAALVMGSGVTRAASAREALTAAAQPLDVPEHFGAGRLDAGAAMRGAHASALWMRVLALALFGLWLRSSTSGPRRLQLGALGGLSVLAFGTGLLPFAPWLGAAGAAREWVWLLARPLPEWGLPLFGAVVHRSAAHAAALPLFLLTALGFGSARLRPVIGGVAWGTAAYCAQMLWSAHADAVGGPFALRLSMACSLVLSLWIARVSLRAER